MERMLSTRRIAIIVVFSIFCTNGLTGCETVTALDKTISEKIRKTGTSSPEPTENRSESSSALSNDSNYSGPRAKLAVIRFTDNTKSGSRSWYSANVGDDIARILTSSLLDSKRFMVLSRSNMADMMNEINLGNSGVVTADSAARFGRMIGSRLVVTGAVIAFEESEGQQTSIGKSQKQGMRVEVQDAHISVNLEVVDVETSELISSKIIDGKSSKTRVTGRGTVGGIGGSVSSWKNQPRGEALEKVISRATDHLVASIPRSYFTESAAGGRKSAAQASPSVEFAQRALSSLGYFDGAIDGKFGPLTSAAIKEFQSENEMSATGKLSPETLRLLRASVKEPTES